jgi:penicillin V acylase-like amidase (Ntn superfamily)
MYELGVHKNIKMCTGILVKKDNYVFHSRNLDYDFP